MNFFQEYSRIVPFEVTTIKTLDQAEEESYPLFLPSRGVEIDRGAGNDSPLSKRKGLDPLIPEAAAEEIIGELQALFARHNVWFLFATVDVGEPDL